MFLILLNLFTSNTASLITLCLIYCFAYLRIFFNPQSTPIFLLAFIGLLIDSINDMMLGLSSTMFVVTFMLIKLELKHFKNIDFLNTYFIFIMNAVLFTFIITLGLLIFAYDKLLIPLQICITSIILLPLTYYTTVLYQYFYDKNENAI